MFWAFALTLKPLFSTTGIVYIISVLAYKVGLAVCYSSSLKVQGPLMRVSIQMNNHMGRLDEHVAVGTNYV